MLNRNNQGLNFPLFPFLPDEVIWQILSYLSARDIASAKLWATRYRDIANILLLRPVNVIKLIAEVSAPEAMKFIREYRSTTAYQNLVEKFNSNVELTADEIICYAFTTDNINTLNYEQLNRAIAQKYPEKSLEEKIEIVCSFFTKDKLKIQQIKNALTEYQKQHENEDIKIFESVLFIFATGLGFRENLNEDELINTIKQCHDVDMSDENDEIFEEALNSGMFDKEMLQQIFDKEMLQQIYNLLHHNLHHNDVDLINLKIMLTAAKCKEDEESINDLMDLLESRKNSKYTNLAGIEISGIGRASEVNLSGVNLENAKLLKVRFNANLANSNLEKATFNNVMLKNADLTNTNLTHTILKDVDLTGANLTNADLSHCVLDNTVHLGRANLTGANFIGVQFQNNGHALLDDARIGGTRFHAKAIFNDKTTLTAALLVFKHNFMFFNSKDLRAHTLNLVNSIDVLQIDPYEKKKLVQGIKRVLSKVPGYKQEFSERFKHSVSNIFSSHLNQFTAHDVIENYIHELGRQINLNKNNQLKLSI